MNERNESVALPVRDEFGGDKPNGIPGLTLGEIQNLLDHGPGDLERFGSFDNPEAVIRDLWHEVNRLRSSISEAHAALHGLAIVCDQVGELTCITNEPRSCGDELCSHHVCREVGCVWRHMDAARVVLLKSREVSSSLPTTER